MTVAAYTVTADVCYIDGILAGLPMRAAYKVTEPNRELALRTQNWLRHAEATKTPVKACTGGHYLVSNIALTEVL